MFDDRAGKRALNEISIVTNRLEELPNSGKYVVGKLRDSKLGLRNIRYEQIDAEIEPSVTKRVELACSSLFERNGESAVNLLGKYLSVLRSAETEARKNSSRDIEAADTLEVKVRRASHVILPKFDAFSPHVKWRAEQLFERVATALDVETSLKSYLEFVLPYTGKTNIAVFIPQTSGDFGLGAYANYSLPRDSAEVLLEASANNVPVFIKHPMRGEKLKDSPRQTLAAYGNMQIFDPETKIFTIPSMSPNSSEVLALTLIFSNDWLLCSYEVLSALGVVLGHHLASIVMIHRRL